VDHDVLHPRKTVFDAVMDFLCYRVGFLEPMISARLLLCLRLKNLVARFPPRMSTGGWLSLS